MDQKLIDELKGKLESQRDSMQKELESFAKKDDLPKGDWETRYPNRENGSMEEEADEVQEYDNLLSLEYSLELRLKDTNSALEKMANNSYGVCEDCEKKITEERLQACPEAKTCLHCKKT